MKPLLESSKYDDYQTPPKALVPLLPYLKRAWTIWECAAGQGNLSGRLIDEGFQVVATDVNEGFDFLDWYPEQYDCIITNPPYSLKDKFLKRVYFLDKPFAFLMPLTTLEGWQRQNLLRKGLELVLLDRRINFTKPSGQGSSSWFATAWFTRGLGIGKELTFAHLGK